MSVLLRYTYVYREKMQRYPYADSESFVIDSLHRRWVSLRQIGMRNT